jgi:magnesium and cobalt exporter, CNNM family
MDDDYYSYFYLVFLISSFIALLSAAFSYLSQQKLNGETERSNQNAITISKLRARYEESLTSLNSVEIIIYIIATPSFFVNTFFQGINYIYSMLIWLGILFASRIICYSIGMRLAENITLKFAPLISLFVKIGSFTDLFSHFLNKIMGGEDTPEEEKEEIEAVVESAREEGNLDEDEYRILKNTLNFSDVLVEDVMTPRTVVFSCGANDRVGDVIKLPELKNYSRFPIWEGDRIDQGLRGYVMTRDVLQSALDGDDSSELRTLANEIYMISETETLDEALELFLQRRQHLFAVIDEFGGFEGLLTMEDVVETMIGAEIVDEADHVVDQRELAKRRRDNRLRKSSGQL